MIPINEMLKRNFGRSQPAQPKPQQQEMAPPEKPAKNVISNLESGASAQRFFDPTFHQIGGPSRSPEIPVHTQVEGTSTAMGTHGPWGTPQEPSR